MPPTTFYGNQKQPLTYICKLQSWKLEDLGSSPSAPEISIRILGSPLGFHSPLLKGPNWGLNFLIPIKGPYKWITIFFFTPTSGVIFTLLIFLFFVGPTLWPWCSLRPITSSTMARTRTTSYHRILALNRMSISRYNFGWDVSKRSQDSLNIPFPYDVNIP